MMKKVYLSKEPAPDPIIRLVQGDTDTQIITFRVPQFAGGVDLKDHEWSVLFHGEHGQHDVSFIGKGELHGSLIEFNWTVPSAVCKCPGRTWIMPEGILRNEDGTGTVWRSESRCIYVAPAVIAKPGEIEHVLQPYQDLIVTLLGECKELKPIVDELEERVEKLDEEVPHDILAELAGKANQAEVDRISESVETIGGALAQTQDKVEEIDGELAGKADKTELAGKADKSELDRKANVEEVAAKQDNIYDLDAIRAGAQAGSTALQTVPLANQYDIMNRTNKSVPASQVDFAVKNALTDSMRGADYTRTEQAAARMRLGAASAGDVDELNQSFTNLDNTVEDHENRIETLENEPKVPESLVGQVSENKRDISVLMGLTEGQVWGVEEHSEDGMNDAPNGSKFMSAEEIHGVSKQNSTNGYNILQNEIKSGTYFEINTIAYDDGHVSFTGTSTNTTYYKLIGYIDFVQGTDYYFNGGFDSLQGNVRLDLRRTAFDIVAVVYSGGNTAKWTATVTERLGVYVRIAQNYAVNNLIVYPMCSITNVSDYEPYTGGIPAPNPDYPQDIESVESFTVRVTGKNLLDESTIFGNADTTIKYAHIKVDNGTYVVSSSLSDRDSSNVALVFAIAGIADSGASSLVNGVFSETPRVITVTDGYITIAYRNYNEFKIKDTVHQLERGSVATAYEPYHEEVRTITPPRPLNAIGEYRDVCDVENGVWKYAINKIAIIGSMLSNTVQYGYAYVQVDDLIKAKDYKTLILSERNTVSRNNNSVRFEYGLIAGYDDYLNQFEGQNWIYIGLNAGTDFGKLKEDYNNHPDNLIYVSANPTSEDITTDDLSFLRSLSMIPTDHTITVVNQNGHDVPWLAKYLVQKQLMQDVQINGTSITENGVANIPISNGGNVGVVRGASSLGTYVSPQTGQISLVKATESEILTRNGNYCPIVPTNLDYAVRTSLTDGKNVFSDTEQAAACSTIGATPQSMVSDAYNASKAYAVGDYCIYNNVLWRCLSACTGVQPVDGANWAMVNVADALYKPWKSKKFTLAEASHVFNGDVGVPCDEMYIQAELLPMVNPVGGGCSFVDFTDRPADYSLNESPFNTGSTSSKLIFSLKYFGGVVTIGNWVKFNLRTQTNTERRALDLYKCNGGLKAARITSGTSGDPIPAGSTMTVYYHEL